MDGRRDQSQTSMTIPAQLLGPLDQLLKPPTAMTPETSESLNEDYLLEVTVGTIKRLIMLGMERYNESVRSGYKYGQAYNDGYIRALKHVLEAGQQ
jgi:hypothetical protein